MKLQDNYNIIYNEMKFKNIIPVINKITEEKRIAKVYNNSIGDYIQISNEEEILQRLSNSNNIIKLYDRIDEHSKSILILEKLDGDLLDLIGSPIYNSSMYFDIFYKICIALKYCHDSDVAHLDIKPENVLYSFSNNIYTIKLADFGSSYITDRSSTVSGFRGTIHYGSPESICNSLYNAKKADIWSLGVLLHVIIINCWPYTSNNIENQIREGNILINPNIPFEYQNLIEEMLNINPDKRPSIDIILLKLEKYILNQKNYQYNIDKKENRKGNEEERRREKKNKNFIHKLFK